MRSRIVRWSGIGFVALCAVLPSPIHAQNADGASKASKASNAGNAGSPKALEITATNLMATDARRREQASARGRDAISRDGVLPGDVIRYQLRFTNITKRPVREVVFTDPVPAGLRFVAAPAPVVRDDVAVTYSIDGGRSYSLTPVIETTVDGKRVTRPAPPESYTHVRWTVLGWVQPDAQVTVEFRAQLAGKEAP